MKTQIKAYPVMFAFVTTRGCPPSIKRNVFGHTSDDMLLANKNGLDRTLKPCKTSATMSSTSISYNLHTKSRNEILKGHLIILNSARLLFNLCRTPSVNTFKPEIILGQFE